MHGVQCMACNAYIAMCTMPQCNAHDTMWHGTIHRLQCIEYIAQTSINNIQYTECIAYNAYKTMCSV